MKDAKDFRAALCIECECVHDRGCMCLDVIREAINQGHNEALNACEKLNVILNTDDAKSADYIEGFLRGISLFRELIGKQRSAPSIQVGPSSSTINNCTFDD